MDALIGKLGATASTPATDPGLQPNKFALQMFGPNATIKPRTESIGFGNPSLAAQIPQGAMATAAPASTPAPAAPVDPWANMGPIGQFFKLIDAQRTSHGMDSLTANPKMMKFLTSGQFSVNNQHLTDNSSGN